MFASAVRIIHLITLAAVVLPAASGCSTLFTAAYLFQPADVPAEFTGLRGKHVAIACRPIVELEFTDAGSARELASLVGAQIGSKVRRTRIISQQEVARWVDEKSAARRMAVPSPARRRVGGGACSSLAGTMMSRRQGGWRCSLCWLAGSTKRGPMAMERDVASAVELSAVLARHLLARQQVGLAGTTKSRRRGGWRHLLIGATSSWRWG